MNISIVFKIDIRPSGMFFCVNFLLIIKDKTSLNVKSMLKFYIDLTLIVVTKIKYKNKIGVDSRYVHNDNRIA